MGRQPGTCFTGYFISHVHLQPYPTLYVSRSAEDGDMHVDAADVLESLMTSLGLQAEDGVPGQKRSSYGPILHTYMLGKKSQPSHSTEWDSLAKPHS